MAPLLRDGVIPAFSRRCAIADRSWVDKTLAAKNCEIIDAVYCK